MEITMKLFRIALAALLTSLASASYAADGLVTIKSPRSTAETAARLTAALQERGLKLFARVDHARRRNATCH
jgi:uncharacterized protein (DUF302 family)